MGPFFSICIPQYSRLPMLLQALDSVVAQQFPDFEICISDDCSPEGLGDAIDAHLRNRGVRYRIQVQARNLRYDGNLRAAIALATGQYCLLLGNDDALAHAGVLGHVKALMEQHGPCDLVIPDAMDDASGAPAHRIRGTGNRGAGPDVAAAHFRDFSFVSGIVLPREPAQRLATDRWDGSEMYQMYLGCRLIAAGHALLEIGEPLVRKDVLTGAGAMRVPALPPGGAARARRENPLVHLAHLASAAIRQGAVGSPGTELEFAL